MKNISLLCLAIILFSCNNTNENPILNSKSDSQSYKFYGKVISQDSIKNLEIEKESLMSEKNPNSRKLANVSNLPTFAFFKNGKLVNEVQTNKADVLLNFVDEAANH